MKFLAFIAALTMSTGAIAADMVPLKAPQRVLQTYTGSGFYWGVHTFAETEKITPIVNDTTLGGQFAVGAAVGVTAGYLWGGNGVAWQAVEAMVSYKNIGVGTAPMVDGTPLVPDSKWSFTQRVKFGGPVEVM